MFFRLIEAPIFPVSLEAVGADISFEEFHAGDRLNLRPGVSILAAPLNHPNGAPGYRIEWGGRSRRLCVDGRRLRRTGAAPAARRRVPPGRNPGCIPHPIPRAYWIQYVCSIHRIDRRRRRTRYRGPLPRSDRRRHNLGAAAKPTSRIGEAIDRQRDASERLIGWIQLSMIVGLGVLFLLSPKTHVAAVFERPIG